MNTAVPTKAIIRNTETVPYSQVLAIGASHLLDGHETGGALLGCRAPAPAPRPSRRRSTATTTRTSTPTCSKDAWAPSSAMKSSTPRPATSSSSRAASGTRSGTLATSRADSRDHRAGGIRELLPRDAGHAIRGAAGTRSQVRPRNRLRQHSEVGRAAQPGDAGPAA